MSIKIINVSGLFFFKKSEVYDNLWMNVTVRQGMQCKVK